MTTRREFVYSGLVVMALLLALAVATRPRWLPHVRPLFESETIAVPQRGSAPVPEFDAASEIPDANVARWVAKGASAFDYDAEPIDAPLAGRMSSLKDAVRRGDAQAALQLHFDLEECVFLTSREARELLLDETLDRTTDPQALSSASSKLDRIERAQRNCAGVSNDDMRDSIAMLKRSAELGNPYSALLYLDRGMPSPEEALRDPSSLARYKQDAYGYLQRAARRCVPEAIDRIAILSRGGTFVPDNPFESYTYFEFSRLAWEMKGIVPRNTPHAQRYAQQMSEGVNENQRRRARENAERMYRDYCL